MTKSKLLLLTLIGVLNLTAINAQTFNPTYIINTAGAADSFKGGYTFAYTAAGAPWPGAFMSIGGGLNNYDLQISANYGSGGKNISFRTHNGDNSTWNSWNQFWHSGNLNRADVDFTAKTLNSTNVYNNGNLWSKQITVSLTNPWPDYVFKPTYILPTLEYVKNYVEKNSHLPEVPSEAEIKSNGLDVGEMNAVLLKKVEELTLYMIEQQKRITTLENKLAHRRNKK